MTDFRKELEQLLNRHNRENGSNTPDSILASYLLDCLTIFDSTTRRRDKWYGREQTYIDLPPLEVDEQ